MKTNRKFLKIGLAALASALIFTAACSNSGNNNPNHNNNNNQTPANNQNADQNETTTHTVTLYYSDEQLMETVRIEQEVEADNEEELPQAALNAWAKGPEVEGYNSLVPEGVTIEFMANEDENVAHVSFSEGIFDANLGSTGEMALVEQVAMIMQQFGYESTQILVDSEKVETLLGHMTVDEPFEAKNPDDYTKIED